MGANERHGTRRIRVAIAGVMTAGALAIGTVSAASASPATDEVTNHAAASDRAHATPVLLGHIRSQLRESVSNADPGRLQAVLDRRGKLESTVSNILKRIAATTGGIIGNTK